MLTKNLAVAVLLSTSMKLISALFILCLTFSNVRSQDFMSEQEYERAHKESLKNFNDLKFGMFVHFGTYSGYTPEASWGVMLGAITDSAYRSNALKFNPVNYNPGEWVKLAQDAGQKYIVFTTKHHDGFNLFDTKHSDYKSTTSPYKKDVTAMLARACQEAKMPLSFYYSPPDFHHPDALANFSARDLADTSRAKVNVKDLPRWLNYLNYMEYQLRELLTNYGSVMGIWFDGLYHQEKYDGERMRRVIYSLQPKAIINNRIGKGDYQTPEQFIPEGIPTKALNLQGTENDANNVRSKKILKRTLPTAEEFQPWETCMTINCCWGYNRNTDYKSDTLLIHSLIDVASKGGNFLLNVGPKADGTIPEEFAVRLRSIGKWLKVNGDAIYGTTFGPLQEFPFGKSTAKGNNVYLHVTKWPKGKLEFKGLTNKIINATLMDGTALKVKQKGDFVSIATPAEAPDGIATVIKLETGNKG
jgi:alpha-L-fucosidase